MMPAIRSAAIAALLLATPAVALDCQPCRYEPGGGAPVLTATAIAKPNPGLPESLDLLALRLVRADGGLSQYLRFEPPPDAGAMPDKDAIRLDQDLDGDGFRDLMVTTEANPAGDSGFWYLWDAKAGKLVPLQVEGPDQGLLRIGPHGGVIAAKVNASGDKETAWYRLEAGRARPVRLDRQRRDSAGKTVAETEDLSGASPRRLPVKSQRFDQNNAEYKAFLTRLDAAAKQAGEAFKAGRKPDAAAALALLEPVVLPSLLLEKRLIGTVNDYGFYLAEAGKPFEASIVLAEVIEADPTRTPAYVNLGDAAWEMGDKAWARRSYSTYRELMQKAGRADRIPARVAERLQ